MAAAQELKPTIISGVVASILITIGSWGVGSLPQSGQSLFSGTTTLVPLRTEFVGVLVCAIVLSAAMMWLMRSWLVLGKLLGQGPRVSVKRLAGIAALWAAPLLFAAPIFSKDVYSYLAQGRLYALGQDPYQGWVSQLQGWFMQGADGLWAESSSPYGPVFIVLAALIWQLSAGIPEVGVLLFRVVSVASMFAMLGSLSVVADQVKARTHFVLWLALLNPLFLVVMVAAAHNDVLMLALMVSGYYWILRRNYVLGLVLIALSIAIKPIVVVAVPFIVLAGFTGQRMRLADKFRYWVPAALVVGVILAGLGVFTTLGFGWVEAMSNTGSAAFPYAPVGVLGLAVGWVFSLVGFQAAAVAKIVYILAKVVAAGVLIWWAWRTQRRRFRVQNTFRDAAFALAVVVLSAPIIQPWYLLWVLPLLACWYCKAGPLWRWVYLLIGLLCLVGVVEQLSIPSWVPAPIIYLAAAAVGVGFLVFFIFGDKATKDTLRVPLPAWFRRNSAGVSTDDGVKSDGVGTYAS